MFLSQRTVCEVFITFIKFPAKNHPSVTAPALRGTTQRANYSRNDVFISATHKTVSQEVNTSFIATTRSNQHHQVPSSAPFSALDHLFFYKKSSNKAVIIN